MRGIITYNRISGDISSPHIFGELTDVMPEPRYADETLALIARMTEEPTTALKDLIDKTIKDLKLAGIWDKLIQFSKCNLHNDADSRLNWKGEDFTLLPSKAGAISHTPKLGYLIGGGYYLRSGLIPSEQIAAGTIDEDDACFGIDRKAIDVPPTYSISGAWNTTSNRYQITLYSVDGYRRYVSGAVLNWGAGTGLLIDDVPETADGMVYGERIGTMNYGYGNGTLHYLNDTVVSTSNCIYELYYGALNNGGSPAYYDNCHIRTIVVGKSTEKAKELYDICKYFNDNIGDTF